MDLKKITKNKDNLEMILEFGVIISIILSIILGNWHAPKIVSGFFLILAAFLMGMEFGLRCKTV